LDDRRRDGGTNSTLRTKELGKHLTLNEHDDDYVFQNALTHFLLESNSAGVQSTPVIYIISAVQ